MSKKQRKKQNQIIMERWQKAGVIFTALSVVVAIVFYLLDSDKKSNEDLFAYINQSNQTIEDTYGVPPAPKFTEASIQVQMPDWDPKSDIPSGIEVVEDPFIGYVISFEEFEDGTIEAILQNAEDRVKSKFYIEKDGMSNADLSWLPYILIEGNKVKVSYYYSGNGGYQYVIKMTNLPR